MTQLLIPWPVAHRQDPASSIEAGEKYHRQGKAESDRQRIINALPISQDKALTHRRIAELTGIDYVAVCRRTKEIEQSGRCERIVDGGLLRCWKKG